MTRQHNIRRFAPIMAAIVWIVLMLAIQVTVYAAPQHGFGQGQGRNGAINENDFHTAAWDRFHFNYHFISGSNHAYELGRSTSFHGFVPVDVFSVNMRRDANVSMLPPSYGVFSGHVPTDPSNRLFQQPVNPNFHQPFMLESPNLHTTFDTLQMGVNAQPIGNPMNMHQNVTTGSFLPHTSIGH